MDSVIKSKLEKWILFNERRLQKGEYFEAITIGLDVTDYELYKSAINLLVETGVRFKDIFEELPLVDTKVIDYQLTQDYKTQQLKLYTQFEEIKDIRIEMFIRYFIPITTIDITPFMQVLSDDTGYIQLTPVPDARYVIPLTQRPQLISSVVSSPREADDIFAEILDDWLLNKYKTYVL